MLVFHATGNGGRAMESLIEEGMFAGVLDITTTELADEHVGGFLTAGPERLTAAGRAGVPQVVSTGAVDMVNFYAPESVPAQFADSNFLQAQRERHADANDAVRRTRPLARTSRGSSPLPPVRVSVLLPARGVSAIDKDGQPFDDPDARRALHEAIRSGLPGVEVAELDLHINDPEFADAAARKLLDLMNRNTL